MSISNILSNSKFLNFFYGIFTILKWESLRTFRNPVYWLITIYVPLLVFSLITQIHSSFLADLQSVSVGKKVSSFVEDWLGLGDAKPIGVWDGAKILTKFPTDVDRSEVRFYSSESTARRAVTNEEVDIVFLIGEEFLEKGELEHKFSDTLNRGRQKKFIHLLRFNLLDGSKERTDLVESILRGETEIVARESDDSYRDYGFFAKFKYFIFLFWTLTITFASIGILGWTDKTLSAEKENLTFEVLLSSVSPRQVLLGKLSALYFTTLLRMFVWIAILFLMGKSLGSGAFFTHKALMAIIVPNRSIVFVLPILFFLVLVGFKLRKSCSSSREDPQTYNLFIGLSLGLLFSLAAMFCILGPESTLTKVLALFPLTSAVVVPILSIQNAISNSEIYCSIFLMALLLLVSSLRSRSFFKF